MNKSLERKRYININDMGKYLVGDLQNHRFVPPQDEDIETFREMEMLKDIQQIKKECPQALDFCIETNCIPIQEQPIKVIKTDTKLGTNFARGKDWIGVCF